MYRHENNTKMRAEYGQSLPENDLKKFRMNTNRVLSLVLAAVLAVGMLFGGIGACAEGADLSSAPQIEYRYLTAEECAQVLAEQDAYYAHISQKALAFFMQSTDASIEDYIVRSQEQARDYTEEEIELLDDCFAVLEETMAANGYNLPENRSVTVALTTMEEALGAGGYTHDTTIFLGTVLFGRPRSEKYDGAIRALVAHELFHCLTRNNPQFRADMYQIIGFTVTDSDYEIPEDVSKLIISNPDVAHHDSYATFTINGEKKDCYLVFLTDSEFKEAGDSFFTTMYTGLVDVATGELYRSDDASDFYDLMGHNTEYCEDPEECMATNFANALAYGMDGPTGEGYASPEIIERILNYLAEN